VNIESIVIYRSIGLTCIAYFIVVNCQLAQISGIAGIKITSINSASMGKGSAEFEPQYNLSTIRKAYDNDGNLVNIYNSSDSLSKQGSIALRMAYGFSDKLEFGTLISNAASNWSAKYEVYNRDKLGLGLMAGLNLPFGSSIIDRKNRQAEQIVSFGLGAIASYNFNENSTVDFNIQWQNYGDNADGLQSSDSFISMDFGHYVKNVLLVSSFIYQTSYFEDNNQNKLSFLPGISLEMKDNFALVFNLSLDLFGKNIQRTTGFGAAWTIAL